MATKSQEILLKGNTTNASAVPSSLKVREIAINALDRSLFTNDGNSIVKLYTGTTKWFDVNGNANNALKADSVAWAGISGKPTTFTPSAHTHTASDVSGLPTSLKNPYALTFGSKTYDGSAAATITASDLGALTAHQSIYALTLQVNGTSKGVYNPASAAKTINIAVPTKTSDITNNSGFITSAAIPTALKNPYAVEIKANGVSLGTYDGSAAATFNLSAANVGAANKVHSHTASEISGLPTNLSAFTNDVGFITGITKSMVEGVLTGDITSHTHSYLPLSGGTLSGSDRTLLRLKSSNSSGPTINFHNPSGDVVTSFGHIPSNTNYGTFLSNVEGQIGLLLSNDGVAYLTTNTNYLTKNYTILHSGNYNSYAPTLTGTGASGTWGISITGNAATATNADTLDGYHASSFYKHATAYPDGSVEKPWHKIATFSQSTVGLNINTSITFYVSEFYNSRSYGIFTVRARADADSASLRFLTVDFLVNADISKSDIVATWKNTGDGNIVINVYAYRIGWSSFSFRKIEEQSWGVPQDKWTTLNASYGNENCYASIPSDENQVVSTNIDICNNVASATKLLDDTAYTAWGQTFFENGKPKNVNGDAHITGDLIVDGEVSALVA